MNLRRFETGDLASLVRVINTVCAEGMMATRRFEPTPAWLHALAELSCPCHLLLVAEDVGRVVGWCRVFRDPPEDTRDLAVSTAEIALGLLSDYRGLDNGRVLLEKAIDWAVVQRLRYVWLSTRPDNDRAVRLFLKSGFLPTGEWRGGEQVMGRGL